MYKLAYMLVVLMLLNPFIVGFATATLNGALQPDAHPLLSLAALLVSLAWYPCWLWLRSLDTVTDKYCADVLRG